MCDCLCLLRMCEEYGADRGTGMPGKGSMLPGRTIAKGHQVVFKLCDRGAKMAIGCSEFWDGHMTQSST